MKSSLWIVIVVVVGVVGYLLGYSVSGYTGSKNAPQAQAGSAEHGSGGGYGAQPAAHKTETAGYGAPAPAAVPAAAPAPAAAGGYGR